MESITVFTPTYNRAYCLHQLYESLCRQSSSDFCWLIIDDGSTDNTKELIEDWIKENRIKIKYRYKTNGGMHTGYNVAYSLIETELNVCIDSDDYLADDAIESILSTWRDKGSSMYAGIVGLDATNDGIVLGKHIPEDLNEATLEDLYHKYRVSGDKKLVYRTEVVKQFNKYPCYLGENLVPLGSLYLQIDKHYPLLCLNQVLCIVEYMEDGSTRNIFRQYRKSPLGFRYARQINLKYSNYWKVKINSIVHYISHCLQLKDYNSILKNPYPIFTLFLLPLGVLLNWYVIFKSK